MFSEDNYDIKNNHSSELLLCLLYAKRCFKHVTYTSMLSNDPNITQWSRFCDYSLLDKETLRQRELKKLTPENIVAERDFLLCILKIKQNSEITYPLSKHSAW